MPSLFESTKSLFARQSAAASTIRGWAWTTGTALAPILPPSVVFDAVTAADALKCPPVARAIGLYSAAMIRRQYIADPVTLEWLTRSTGPVPAKLRDIRTLVDLILHNRAAWVLSRDSAGRPYEAVHLPVSAWSHDDTGVLVVNGHQATPAQAAAVVIFHGAMTLSFLEAAQDTLQHYKDLTLTIKDRAANPMAMQELKVLEDYDGPMPGDPDYEAEFDQVLNAQKSYAAARRAPGGAVTVTPRNMQLIVHQADDDGAMLIDARNAVRIDVANHTNINAAMLDGNNGTSDTYSNTLQNVNEFSGLSLGLFADPITLRLSMDDLTPVGQEVTWTELDIPGGDPKGNAGTAVGILQDGSAGAAAGPSPEIP